MTNYRVTKIGIAKPAGRKRKVKTRSPRKTRPNPVNRKRKKRESERAYGGSERTEFVKSLRCIVTLKFGTEDDPIDNVHTETGGTSRKADADKIVPMLRSKHRELHVIGPRTFERKYPHVRLEEAAENTEKLWQSHLNSERAIA